MKRWGNLDDAEQDILDSTINSARTRLTERSKAGNKFGLCSTCKSFEFAESEFNIFHARCSRLERRLRESQPIIRCSCFRLVGQMELWEMKEIAYLVDSKDRTVGFKG